MRCLKLLDHARPSTHIAPKLKANRKKAHTHIEPWHRQARLKGVHIDVDHMHVHVRLQFHCSDQ